MLDVQTLLIVLLAQVFATAIALPVLMGWRVSQAARLFQASVIAQAVAWLLFLLARSVHDHALSTMSIGVLSLSFALLWSSLNEWLGHRPGRRLMWAAAILTPVGYGLTFSSYAVRVGWSNFGLALQMLIICVALAWPATRATLRWRSLVLVAFGTLCLVTAWRGVLGAFFTEAYPFYRATHPVNLIAALFNVVALSLTTLGLLTAWREEAERDLRRQAQTDGLTGLNNRQNFSEQATNMLANATRYNEPLAAVMIDIDHFKRINDTHGHAAGDTALQVMAQGLRACVRRGDLAGRYGGEEFCVLLSRATLQDAGRFDTRLRAWLKAHADEGHHDLIDFSAGAAALQSSDVTISSLFERADAALYLAKTQGRSRIVFSQPGTEQTELAFCSPV